MGKRGPKPKPKKPACLNCIMLDQDINVDAPRKSTYRCADQEGRKISLMHHGIADRWRPEWCGGDIGFERK